MHPLGRPRENWAHILIRSQPDAADVIGEANAHVTPACQDLSGAVARKAGSLYLKESCPNNTVTFVFSHSPVAQRRADLICSIIVGNSWKKLGGRLLSQVADRACDEGVRVMDKGVEKAGAVLDKGP